MKRFIILFLYSTLAFVYLFSLLNKNNLPKKEFINPLLLREPIQVSTNKDEFDFSYRGSEYNVEPLADYELWGLVVSVNNINAWYNYYHDENTVNLKDFCVVWGDNISNEVYRDSEIKFKSGEWTCYYQWTGRLEKKFYPNKLSNNHLLSADEQIQEIIRNVKIGDQIYLKGSLVDYAKDGNNWYRKTSLSRDDSNQSSRSGGACEIMYVEEIKILEKNNPLLNQLNQYSKISFLFLMLFHFSIFTTKIFLKYK